MENNMILLSVAIAMSAAFALAAMLVPRHEPAGAR
jgi:hypothetical protein